MRIKNDFEIIQIADDYMVVPVGDNMDTFQGTVVLNEISAFILNHMKKPIEKEDLCDLILKEYLVDRETAMKDLEETLKQMCKIGLIE